MARPAWRLRPPGSQWKWPKWWWSLCSWWYLSPGPGWLDERRGTTEPLVALASGTKWTNIQQLSQLSLFSLHAWNWEDYCEVPTCSNQFVLVTMSYLAQFLKLSKARCSEDPQLQKFCTECCTILRFNIDPKGGHLECLQGSQVKPSAARFSPKPPRLIGPEARKIILLLDVMLPRGFDSLKMKQRKSKNPET